MKTHADEDSSGEKVPPAAPAPGAEGGSVRASRSTRSNRPPAVPKTTAGKRGGKSAGKRGGRRVGGRRSRSQVDGDDAGESEKQADGLEPQMEGDEGEEGPDTGSKGASPARKRSNVSTRVGAGRRRGGKETADSLDTANMLMNFANLASTISSSKR